MAGDKEQPSGPDLTQGVVAADIRDGAMLLGHVGDEAVLLARRGAELFAIGATCTHYNGPLAEGLMVDDTVRCPLHHACFSLRTGEALRAPALNPVSCWKVEQDGPNIFVRQKIEDPEYERQVEPETDIKSIVIIGGGAAGNAASEMLRRQGFEGKLTIVSADNALPYDRPNLSKDYLAGTASEDWIPLRSEDFYAGEGIAVRLKSAVTSIDVPKRTVSLSGGEKLPFDRLLLATGADPVQLDVPGGDLPHVHYLRSWDDSRAIIAKVGEAKKVVVIGASFIGLEVAASLRHRDLEVHVVGPQSRPLEKVLGPELGDMVKAIHEKNGVVFHFGTSVTAIEKDAVVLKNGKRLSADLVVAGIGVRPSVGLAEQAGISADNGILVDRHLQTSIQGIYAAGDIASWPDPHTGKAIRVEHWVVAEREGQTAAINMLGGTPPFDAVPFFWSQHYDVTISYVGYAEKWDRIEIDGDPAKHDCKVTYFGEGKKLAVATVSRDLESLKAEVELERS
jgi:NADPH-dependent 2,4-dienoyl-CoA reductase/sulfur reductase-like enzyme/nitrite reductase/ring-hydroxylating ferredoxin subunit